ncbi:S1 family peptidase [Catenovulum sediminis]|uniref:S1 family peptidase n=1 Tax=Catenovulum sediminis TaxID=1740262 RepID=UPI001180DF4E|nr:serine protease [Catenovulum sediminis]
MYLSSTRSRFLTFLVIVIFHLPVHASELADQLIKKYESSVFQVQLIERQSNKKSAIGSGFLIEENKVITNYHVVSSYINSPAQYSIELLSSSDEIIKASLLNFDVVNDLAVLSLPKTTAPKLKLAAQTPQQGAEIYSIGNPHDYGMIVVPGTYNGVTAHSFYQRIHFTGSINPGMSGGPVLDKQGNIVGVNVATAGNQIGFLVPLWHLDALLKKPILPFDKYNYQDEIERQLTASQDRLFADLLQRDWQTTILGQSLVLAEIAPYLPCWGQSNAEQDKAMFAVSEINCISKEQLFISNGMRTGNIEVQFSWIEKEQLNDFQFSHLLTQSFSRAGPGNSANKKNVTNFHCYQDFSKDLSAHIHKSTFCVRNYKKYPSLYDALYISVSANNTSGAALMSHFTLAGVSQQNATAFLNKFMESVTWN